MAWIQGLKQNGQYFDGIVSSVDDHLDVFKRTTVTSWGTRRSSNPGDKDIAVSFGWHVVSLHDQHNSEYAQLDE